MQVSNTTTKPTQSRSPSSALIENNDDCQPHVTFLPNPQHQNRHEKKPKLSISNNTLASASTTDRTPARLLELKQQRLLAAANRKKRLITRIISVVGLFIILLCAAIVALTLKMAPQIDELVRTKTGSHQSVHLLSRMPIPSTTTKEFNNFTTNSSLK